MKELSIMPGWITLEDGVLNQEAFANSLQVALSQVEIMIETITDLLDDDEKIEAAQSLSFVALDKIKEAAVFLDYGHTKFLRKPEKRSDD